MNKFTNMEIGVSAKAWFGSDIFVYGTISCTDEAPIYTLETPGGSKIRSGAVWIRELESVDDFYKLFEYDLLASRRDSNELAIQRMTTA